MTHDLHPAGVVSNVPRGAADQPELPLRLVQLRGQLQAGLVGQQLRHAHQVYSLILLKIETETPYYISYT